MLNLHCQQVYNSNLIHTHTSWSWNTYFSQGMLNVSKKGNNAHHNRYFLWFFSLPFCLSAFMFRSGSLSLCLEPSFITPFVLQYIQNINKYSCCISSNLWLVLLTAPNPAQEHKRNREMGHHLPKDDLLWNFCIVLKEVGVAIVFLILWVYVSFFHEVMKFVNSPDYKCENKDKMWKVCASDRRWHVEESVLVSVCPLLS